MARKTSKTQNRREAAKRTYGYTSEQIKALEELYGQKWTKLSKKAQDMALVTMGLK